jgi:ParB family chromosome partitioning protein
MTTTDKTAPTVEHGTTVFIPLNKLNEVVPVRRAVR